MLALKDISNNTMTNVSFMLYSCQIIFYLLPIPHHKGAK